ncbi:MAG TPA: hypothetical protein QF753_23355, partial [Victivallales bacterium]|nr:hypothetical protein [Victivallales bacterium]
RKKLDAAQQEHTHALQAIEDNEKVAISRQKAIKGSGKFGMGKTQGGKEAEKEYAIAVKSKNLLGQKTALQRKYAALEASSNNKSAGHTKASLQAIGREKAAITMVIKKLDDQIFHEQEIVRLNRELEGSLVVQGELLDRQEKKLANKELRTKGYADITNVAETKGMNAAFKEFGKQTVIVERGLQGMDKTTKFFSMSLFKLKGAFSIAAVGAQTLMMALGPIMMAVSILVPIFMGLFKLMGFFSEEAKAVTEAQKNLEEQTKMLSKKLAHQNEIYRNSESTHANFLDAMLAQQIAVKEVMKAVLDLEEAQKEYAKNTNAFVKSMNWLWDGFKDFMAGTISMIETEEFGLQIKFHMRDLDANKTQEILNGIIGDPDKMSKAMKDYLNSFNISSEEFFMSADDGGALMNKEKEIVEALTRIDFLKKKMRESDTGVLGILETIELEKLEKGMTRLYATQQDLSFDRAKAFKDAGIEMKELLRLQDRQIAGAENLKSIQKGAQDALNEYRDKFITKTDVDKPLASFTQLIDGLQMDKEKMVVTDAAIVSSLKEIVQQESAMFLMMSKDRQEAYKLALGFTKGVEGAPDTFVDTKEGFEEANRLLTEQRDE